VARGVDPSDCERLLRALELATAHVAVMADLEREDVNGKRERWAREREGWRAILRETIDALGRDPTSDPPCPRVTSIRINRELRELHAQA
jgi:hypothetical protein